MTSHVYIDISALYENDLRTGIQRVVRSILKELSMTSSTSFVVIPVYYDLDACDFHIAYRYFIESKNNCLSDIRSSVVEPTRGDIFFGLDLHHSVVISAHEQGIYEKWKSRGVLITFLVYDLLPILRPDVFPPNIDTLHKGWLEILAKTASTLISISKSVRNELECWLVENGHARQDLKLEYFHLGADISSSQPTFGLPTNYIDILDKIKSKPSFLMVGTIEPRKGHLQVLKTFELLWAKGYDLNLVIVGHEGWKEFPDDQRGKIPHIVSTLKEHPLLGERLHWLEGISDEFLDKVYDVSVCHISASLGEGFGLPIIESARHNLPVIARDIPIFRELCGDGAFYFPNTESPLVLSDYVCKWLDLLETRVYPDCSKIKWLTWEESGNYLSALLLKEGVF